MVLHRITPNEQNGVCLDEKCSRHTRITRLERLFQDETNRTAAGGGRHRGDMGSFHAEPLQINTTTNPPHSRPTIRKIVIVWSRVTATQMSAPTVVAMSTGARWRRGLSPRPIRSHHSKAPGKGRQTRSSTTTSADGMCSMPRSTYPTDRR